MGKVRKAKIWNKNKLGKLRSLVNKHNNKELAIIFGTTVYSVKGAMQCFNIKRNKNFSKYLRYTLTRKQIIYEIDKDTQCWICTSHMVDPYGYPVIWRNNKRVKISRYQYEKYKGKIPKGHVIRHTCDNRKCINPDHLLTGTPRENAFDAIHRGRNPKGEKHGMAKLTDEMARKIKIDLLNSIPRKEIATQYKVHISRIHDIASGKVWKHIIM
jgi:hypothetical protein